MKLAIPAQQNSVNQHFGRSEAFAIFDINDGKVTGKKLISATGYQHQHEHLADLLKAEGVSVVITGGIGQGAIDSLNKIGFEVLTGANGELDTIAKQYADGKFISKSATCNHHEHGHHHK